MFSDANICRLAFNGTLIKTIDETQIAKLKVFTEKEKEGVVERVKKIGILFVNLDFFEFMKYFQKVWQNNF